MVAMKELGSVINELKLYIKRYVDSQVPGYIASIDNVFLKETGRRVIDLLFEEHSKVYQVLKKYYGSEVTADFAVLNLFLKPIAVRIGRVGIEEQFLILVKQGKDREFLELLRKCLARQ